MMDTKECIALILAGGIGKRLGSLTQYNSKPMVFFGGTYRVIDFAVSNCVNSRINTVGILGHSFLNDLSFYANYLKKADTKESTFHYLPPSVGNRVYPSTVEAVRKNIGFINRFEPENVLVLSGDNIYKMDYSKLLKYHKKTDADVTVASTEVPIEDASRYGVVSADDSGRIRGLIEKPFTPPGNLVSMGIYVFKWSKLREYLLLDYINPHSEHDFGKNIIPSMVGSGDRVFTYRFNDYWKDVGTVESLWNANMDLIDDPPGFMIHNRSWDIIDVYDNQTPNFISSHGTVNNSMLSGGCEVYGSINNCVLADSVVINQGAEVSDCFIMPNVYIGKGVKINKAIIGRGVIIENNVEIGYADGTDELVDTDICSHGVSLVGPHTYIAKSMRIKANSHINRSRLDKLSKIRHGEHKYQEETLYNALG